METLLLIIGLALFSVNAVGDEKESQAVTQMRSAGFIIVIDSETKPVEVQIESEGDTIVCYSQEHNDSRFYTLHKRMFEKGQFSVLLQCAEGELSVKQGYI